MRRSYLQCSGTKLPVHILIHDNGNRTVHQWYQYLLAVKFTEALILRMHTYRGIAQNGLGTGGGNGDKFFFSLHLVSEIV